MTKRLIVARALQLLAIPIAGVLVILFLNRGNSLVAPSPLRSLLTGQGCDQACWRGITPGVTDRENARAILEHAGIAFVDVPLPDPEMNAVYDFSQAEENESKGFVSISGAVVSQLALVIDACVSRVVAEYGEPAEVRERDDYFYLLYPDAGVVFSLNGREDMTHISLVYLVSDVITNFAGGDLEHNWKDFADRFAGECADSFSA